MGRTAGRSPEDTRSLLLSAVAEMIRAKGSSATLDDIAGHAGVSKGGLLYHFASKDELLIELAKDLLSEFRICVEAEIDPDDREPGRFTRAYVRALLSVVHDEAAARESVALVAQLVTNPAIAELARAESDAIEARLRADGLPDEVRVLIVAAADGANSAPIWGGASRSPAELGQLEQRLILLTREPGLWQQVTATLEIC